MANFNKFDNFTFAWVLRDTGRKDYDSPNIANIAIPEPKACIFNKNTYSYAFSIKNYP